jgi:hypothetical protein
LATTPHFEETVERLADETAISPPLVAKNIQTFRLNWPDPLQGRGRFRLNWGIISPQSAFF